MKTRNRRRIELIGNGKCNDVTLREDNGLQNYKRKNCNFARKLYSEHKH